MQQPFSCVPSVYASLESTISSARLARYLPEARNDKHYAVRLYVWNARLCEEFYLPLQIAEVSVRNAIHKTLIRRFGVDWHDNAAITGLLTAKYQKELADVVQSEKGARGSGFTADHVVQGMTFGFWAHLLTARYDQILWQGGVVRSFPHISRQTTREDVHGRVDRMRNFRNKVAHHFAIFDRSPTAENLNIQEVIAMICPDTLWMVKELSNPVRVLSKKPRS